MTSYVLDASAVVELLSQTRSGRRITLRIAEPEAEVHIPHLCPVEVTNALRGLVRGNKLTAHRAQRALGDLATFPATRHSVELLLPRIWSLRSNFTAYDAVYVALAEALEATLLTVDRKIARAYGRYATVDVVD